MNRPGPVTSDTSRHERRVFVSYATADRKQALSVCKAIERRGTKCWMSTRDVRPGENYQEAIVRSIRAARAMVLVFSDAANDSDEIKKELSLASRYRIPVMALRIEDVEPSDAFAYELSTRQWIDAFDGWDESIDALVETLDQLSAGPDAFAGGTHATHHRRASRGSRRVVPIAAAIVLVLGIAGASWLLLRPRPAAAHSTVVRLAGFERLSPDLPSTMPDAVRDEFVSSFPEDETITISTAAAPPPGNAASFALGGTLRRDGQKLRAIARLTDDRTGALIWSQDFEYPADSPDKAPHWFAVAAASILQCSLSAAATYPKALPQKSLSLLFSACGADSSAQALDAARRLVRLTPDFSAGWSALAGTSILYAQAARSQHDALHKEAWAATEKAIQLDPNNADAYVNQNHLLPHGELIRREALLKRAVAARPTACGCEHYFYGWFLWEVGRVHDAQVELLRGVARNPFDIQMRVNLAETILLQGYSAADADEQYRIAADMVPDPDFVAEEKLWSAPITGDYVTALQVLSSGGEKSLPPDLRTALTASYKALISGDAAAKSKAASMFQAVAEDHRTYLTVLTLGALGANGAALEQMRKWDSTGSTIRARLFLWYPSMRGVISDPGFPAVAQQMGLMTYWKTTHTRPDVCSAKDAPPFCRMI